MLGHIPVSKSLALVDSCRGLRNNRNNGDNGDNGDDGLRQRRGGGAGEITDIQAAALASQALYASAVLGD